MKNALFALSVILVATGVASAHHRVGFRAAFGSPSSFSYAAPAVADGGCSYAAPQVQLNYSAPLAVQGYTAPLAVRNYVAPVAVRSFDYARPLALDTGYSSLGFRTRAFRSVRVVAPVPVRQRIFFAAPAVRLRVIR